MKRLIRIGLLSVLALLLLEGGLRLLGYGRYIIYEPDETLLWVPVQSQQRVTVAERQTITINSFGLRYLEDFPKQDSEETRIYSFGDSVTMGWGVDDHSHYSAVLEDALNRGETRKPYRVVSAGVNAYQISLCVRRFEELLKDGHQIDVAIFAYSFNTGFEHFDRLQGKEREGMLKRVRLKSILRRSALYNSLIEDFFRAAVYYRLRDRLTPGTWEVSEQAGQNKESGPIHSYKADLARLHQEAIENDTDLIFLLLGSMNQPEMNEFQRTFIEFAELSSIPLVSTFEAFHDQVQEDLFFPGDVNHPNTAGHALIAKALFPMAEESVD